MSWRIDPDGVHITKVDDETGVVLETPKTRYGSLTRAREEVAWRNYKDRDPAAAPTVQAITSGAIKVGDSVYRHNGTRWRNIEDPSDFILTAREVRELGSKALLLLWSQGVEPS